MSRRLLCLIAAAAMLSLLATAAATTIDGSVSITGALTPKAFNCPAGAITDAGINSGTQIAAAKVVHQHLRGHAQPNTTATTETRTIHVARYAGTVVDVVAGSIAANVGAATVTLDVKKNGTTILTGTTTLDNANTARVVEAATINPASAAYVAGDWFEIVLTATAGGGTLATGVYAQATFNENSQ